MPSQTSPIQIPVLPHVKSLLLSLYGPEPLHISENNLLGKELQFVYLNDKAFSEKINGEKITIQFSSRLTPYFSSFKNAFSLGCFFEKQFNALLFTHVEAQRDCGIFLTDSIKSFFRLYNISEEYYNLQSAMEAYRRIKSKAALFLKKDNDAIKRNSIVAMYIDCKNENGSLPDKQYILRR